MQKVLYYPGGPGLNANPERNLLTDDFEKAGFNLVCYDEPSIQRQEGYVFTLENAFQNYLDAAAHFFMQHYNGTPLILLGHCFGSFAVTQLLNAHPEKVKMVFIITPDFCISKSDRNILRNVMEDYRKYDEKPAKELQEILDSKADNFDENIQRGWQIAAESRDLFEGYWRYESDKTRFTSYYIDGYAPDPVSFFNTRLSWFPLKYKPSDKPVVVLYGKHDRIISLKDELSVLPLYFANMKVIEMEESSHYPQIEETDEVLRILMREVQDI